MSTTAPAYAKEIVYDRETRDYKMLLDGDFMGYARTYREAEIILDQFIYEQLTHGAHELDTGSDPCKMDVLGDYWTNCRAPSDGPCMCDVVVAATCTTCTTCTACGDPLPRYADGLCAACLESDEQSAPTSPCCVCGKSLPCPGPATCDDCRPSLAFRCDCGELATTIISGAALGSDGEPKDLFFCDACNPPRWVRAPGNDGPFADDDPTWHDAQTGEYRAFPVGYDPNGKFGGRELESVPAPTEAAIVAREIARHNARLDADPAPPVDDGPDDNFGGFRSPRCPACDGAHHIQHCGELLARLFAPDEPSAALAQLDGWGCEPGPLVEAMAC